MIPNYFDLTGKVAVITGGSRGIGFSIAKGLAECGAQILLCGRTPVALDQARASIGESVVTAITDTQASSAYAYQLPSASTKTLARRLQSSPNCQPEIINMTSSFLALLADALGAESVFTSEDELRAYSHDSWPLAAKWDAEEMNAHLPVCVVRPTEESGVVHAVRIARSARRAVVPYGAGSGVCGAVVSKSRPIVLDLRAMDRIVKFDPQACLLEVEAGAIAMNVEKWLNERGFTLGHYPQSMPIATMGGLVSTRSSGTFSSKYGNIEDLLVAVDVVLASGEIVRTPRTVRSATGPDVKQLFVGAEGTLGILTRVVVRIFHLPELRWFGGYAFPSLDAGLKAVSQAFAYHIRPAVLRLYDQTEAASLYDRSQHKEVAPLLIVGHEGRSRMVEAERSEFELIAAEHGGRPLGSGIGNAWEQHRFDASWLETGNASSTKFADAIEVAAFWPSMAMLYHEAMRRIAPLCSRAMGHYSHFYSTGGALYIIFFVEGTSRADAMSRYAEVWREVMSATIECGGTISHHHGIGRARAALLGSELGSAKMILSALKEALDPTMLFNPGHFTSQETHEKR